MHIYAHRGSSGTHPENTLAAFRHAASLPIHGVEFDVHLTKDGELVVIHDEKINRTSNGKGFVKDLTLAELKTYDFGVRFSKEFKGEKIPQLTEVLEIFSKTTHHINIELKTDVVAYDCIVEKTLQLVESMALQSRVVISSFNHDTLREVKKLAPHIETATLSMKEFANPFDYVHEIPADGLHISLRTARRPSTEKVVSQGVPVRVFTVNKVKHIDLLTKIGVQAIFTDFPEKVLAYLNENKLQQNIHRLLDRGK